MGSLLRHLAVVLGVAAGGYYAYTALTGPRGLAAIRASHEEVRKMEEDNERLRLEIEKHKQYVQQLRTDPEARDRAIRQRLEKQKPGEKTIYDQPTPPRSPPPPPP